MTAQGCKEIGCLLIFSPSPEVQSRRARWVESVSRRTAFPSHCNISVLCISVQEWLSSCLQSCWSPGKQSFCTIQFRPFLISESPLQLLPSLSLGAPISFLSSSDKRNMLMAITCEGKLYVWDIDEQKNTLLESVRPAMLHPNSTIGTSSTHSLTS